MCVALEFIFQSPVIVKIYFYILISVSWSLKSKILEHKLIPLFLYGLLKLTHRRLSTDTTYLTRSCLTSNVAEKRLLSKDFLHRIVSIHIYNTKNVIIVNLLYIAIMLDWAVTMCLLQI